MPLPSGPVPGTSPVSGTLRIESRDIAPTIATVAVEYHALVVVIADLLASRGLGPAAVSLCGVASATSDVKGRRKLGGRSGVDQERTRGDTSAEAAAPLVTAGG